MTVFVDDMSAAFKPTHRPGRMYVLSHMIADTDKELHAMAAKIGVARRWFQLDHYDVAQSKRAVAVEHGAVEITWRQAGAMMFLRRRGLPMGSPEEAEEKAMARRRSGK